MYNTHSSKVAHGLEVDEVVLSGVQGAVPVAIVGVVVSHGKRRGLWEAARRQFGCIVLRCTAGLRFTVRCGNREALLSTQLSLHLSNQFLLHHHLIRAAYTQ